MIFRLDTISSEPQIGIFSSRNWQVVSKIHMESQLPQNKQNNFERISDFKVYYKGMNRWILWYCHKNRCIHQWDLIDNPEIHTCIYVKLIVHKWEKTI